MRMFARKSVHLGRDAAAVSYWIKRDPPGPQPNSMSDQF